MPADPRPNLWDAVRSWADSAGLLLPTEPDEPARPRVPQDVCDSCPICQAAATVDQINPEAVSDLVEMARSVVTGLASAMASASDQRDHGPQDDRGSAEGSGSAEGPSAVADAPAHRDARPTTDDAGEVLDP